MVQAQPGVIVAQHGVTIDQLSCLDMSDTSRFGLDVSLPSPDNLLTTTGMGNFIRSLARGLPVKLNTEVTAIRWRDRNRIVIETSAGAVTARAVVVTVPLAVLASGSPIFNPQLPQGHQKAIAGLGTGLIEKVWLEFSRDVFQGVETNTMATLLADQPHVQLAQSKWWGSNASMSLISGATVKDVEKDGTRGLIQYALTAVRNVFGGNPARYLTNATSSSWLRNDFSMGAYSYARPGGVPLRAALAQSIDDRIFFAGEAVSVLKRGSLPGAWETGHSAASQALEAMGVSTAGIAN
jgi:monoamine oxidase